MATDTESVCCFDEGAAPRRKLTGLPCICEHKAFYSVCLSRPVLRTALHSMRETRGLRYQSVKLDVDDTAEGSDDEDEVISNTSYRFGGYKQYTLWAHGKLGKSVRKVIPSCALWKIREKFSSETKEYVPFSEGTLDDANTI